MLYGIKRKEPPSSGLPDSLPEPDAFGNFWLGKGKDGKPTGPAVLISCRPGYWFALTTEEVLFQGGSIRYFDTPEAALEALRSPT